MALAASRVVLVGESPYAHEQEAIRFAQTELPNTDPYHLWALLELVEPSTGRLYEIDLLVLGFSALYLVEVKSGPGRYDGDQVDWYRTPPDEPRRWMEPPLKLTNLKAKILKSRLCSKMKQPNRAPRVEPLVFLSNPATEIALSSEGRLGVVTRQTLVRAITHHEFPGSPPGWRADRIDVPLARDIMQALDAIGVRKRKGKLHVGPYELGPLLEDGLFHAGGPDVSPSGYQDRTATHRENPAMRRRARVYLVPQQVSVERRQLLRRAAEREAVLLESVREHENILKLTDYVTDAPLGPTVLFDSFDGGIPLDAFLRQNPELPFAERVMLVEQIARALAYCHKKGVIHGALGPHAVLVRRDAETSALQTRLFNFQLGASRQMQPTVHWSALASEPWAVYRAPELREEPGGPTRLSDIFSLGALAYLVFTARPPAQTVSELDEKLARDGHLDARAVSDSVPEQLAGAIELATERVLALRADDVVDWIEIVLEIVTRPATPAEPEAEVNPTEARKGDVLGGDLEVLRVLGFGATSRVLEVKRASDDRAYALKVSLSPDHDERLAAEADIIDRLDHARIVRLVERRTLVERVCLLLTLAGDVTLQKYLAREGSVSLDYASRFGEDLLSALMELEDKQVVHRDIKPANLGVGSVGKTANHLTLFDFSLGLSPRSELSVGTAVYRDPHLRQRGAWDAAADRWSAAVTLHEMLTGVRPSTEDDTVDASGGSAVLPPRSVVAAERFDPAVRGQLVAFFERAFTPDAELRFPSAKAMRLEWIRCFDAPSAAVAVSPAAVPTTSTPAPEPRSRVESPTAAWDPAALTAEQLAAIQPDTPVEALPLSARARNALDRAGVSRAADLLALPDNRLSSIRGVGTSVAREILGLRDRWQASQTLSVPDTQPFHAAGYRGDDVILSTTTLDGRIAAALGDAGILSLGALAAAPASQIAALGRRHGFEISALTELLERESRLAGERVRPSTVEAWLEVLLPASKKRAGYIAALYGLADPFVGRLDVSVRELAAQRGVTPPNVYQMLAVFREAWTKHGAMRELRDLVREIVADGGGALPLERAGDALRNRIPHDRTAGEALLRARPAALVRIVAEVERDDLAGGLRIARILDRPWIVASDAHAEVVAALGRAADELAARSVIAAPSEAARIFGELVQGTPLSMQSVERLADLAATASRGAARSTRLEIYPRGLRPERSLELSATLLNGQLPPDVVQRRVAARYPDAAPLPDRPALDDLLAAHGLHWSETEGSYRRMGDAPATTLQTAFSSLTRLPTATGNEARGMDPDAVAARDFDDKLAHALDRGLLRVLGVSADRARDAALLVARRAGTEPVSFDTELIAEMKRQMGLNEVEPDVVYRADRDGPGGPAWPNLIGLAELAAAEVARRLLPPKRPLLLVQPGLIARYRLEGFLDAMVAASRERDAAAILLLVPAHDGAGLPSINGQLPIRGVLPTDALWVAREWLANKHNAAA